jgi:hypothetical protein
MNELDRICALLFNSPQASKLSLSEAEWIQNVHSTIFSLLPSPHSIEITAQVINTLTEEQRLLSDGAALGIPIHYKTVCIGDLKKSNEALESKEGNIIIGSVSSSSIDGSFSIADVHLHSIPCEFTATSISAALLKKNIILVSKWNYIPYSTSPKGKHHNCYLECVQYTLFPLSHSLQLPHKHSKEVECLPACCLQSKRRKKEKAEHKGSTQWLSNMMLAAKSPIISFNGLNAMNTFFFGEFICSAADGQWTATTIIFKDLKFYPLLLPNAAYLYTLSALKQHVMFKGKENERTVLCSTPNTKLKFTRCSTAVNPAPLPCTQHNSTLLSYRGYITRSVSDAVLELDHSLKLYLTHVHCTAKALRVGAQVLLQNAHPIFYDNSLTGIGCCNYTHLSILSFAASIHSPHIQLHQHSSLFRPFWKLLSIPEFEWYFII